MHPDLVKLLDLQACDMALREVDTALADVQASETALDDRLKRAEHELEAATRTTADTTSRRDALMQRVDDSKAQQVRRQQRLDQVKNMKEATAVTAEIDLGRQVLAREESEWIQLAEETGRLEARRAAAAQALSEARGAQETERGVLGARRAELQGQRAIAFTARTESASRLERPLRARYDRLHNSKASNALVPLRGFSCSVCFTAVPVSRRGQIRGGLLLEGCEVCGAILYVPVPAEGAAAATPEKG
jgi:predicted  nucleic acid-binding Zn-ribbon protein